MFFSNTDHEPLNDGKEPSLIFKTQREQIHMVMIGINLSP